MVVSATDTQNALASIEQALREHAEPALARRVDALMESMAEGMVKCGDALCGECYPYRNPGSAFAEKVDATDCLMLNRMTANEISYVVTSGSLRPTHRYYDYTPIAKQENRYSYDTVEGRMEDWRGTHYYRGDRLLIPVADNDGKVTMAEVVYEDIEYEDDTQLNPVPKSIRIKVVRDSRNVLPVGQEATLDYEDLHAATAVML